MSSRKRIGEKRELDGRVLAWNERYEIGTFVRFWNCRSDIGDRTRDHAITWTTSAAWLFGDRDPMVCINYPTGGVRIDHLEVIPDECDDIEEEAEICRSILWRARSILDPNDKLDILFEQCERVERFLKRLTES